MFVPSTTIATIATTTTFVVAEGAKRAGGEETYADKETRRLGGIAYQVAEDISRHIDLETRVTVLGHTQRGGSPIALER